MPTKVLAALSAALLLAATLAIGSSGAGAAVPTDTSAFRDAVTIEGIQEHLAALQTIADAHDDTREASSTGYQASVEYVVDELTAAGYSPEIQEFEYPYFENASVPVLERVDPTPITDWRDGTSNFPTGDFATMTFSGSGSGTDVVVTPVDLSLDDPVASSSGCEAADFADFPTGTVALVQRGSCSFADKVANARDAGAVAAIVFNQGDDASDPERMGVFFGTLGGVVDAAFPSFSASFAVGEALAGPGTTVTYAAETVNENRTSMNVIAETPGGRDDRVVVVGAHLDSVAEGPGINDNGTGSAGVLEIAQQLAGTDVTNKVRFAFWGAEEAGLVGSEHYVGTLSKKQRQSIALNLNFDMIGSPNYARFVYDGDGSATGASGPTGSANVEKVFLDYFESVGLAVEPTAFDGRSDYGPFIDAGIPAGGLFSGAEDIKSPEQAALYGGVAGVAFDPCYHAACDTDDNVNAQALDELGDAAAHAVLTFAMTTSSVTGSGKASTNAAKPDHDGFAATR